MCVNQQGHTNNTHKQDLASVCSLTCDQLLGEKHFKENMTFLRFHFTLNKTYCCENTSVTFYFPLMFLLPSLGPFDSSHFKFIHC